MEQPIYKIIDDKGRVLVPQEMRTALGMSKGDIVALRADGGRLTVKKAVVVDGTHMPPKAKLAYVEAALREFDGEQLGDILVLSAKLLREKGVMPF